MGRRSRRHRNNQSNHKSEHFRSIKKRNDPQKEMFEKMNHNVGQKYGYISENLDYREKYNQNVTTRTDKIIQRNHSNERNENNNSHRYHDEGNLQNIEQTRHDGFQMYEERQCLSADQREDEYAIQLMRERENEIININQKVHTVNEIYKDLASLVQGQQDLIDQIDKNLENAKVDVKNGVQNYTEARRYAEHSFWETPFDVQGSGDDDHRSKKERKKEVNDSSSKSKRRKERRNKSRSLKKSESDDGWNFPYEDDIKELVSNMASLGSQLVKSCTAPEEYEDNAEYNTYYK
jgi:hypothetical protein